MNIYALMLMESNAPASLSKHKLRKLVQDPEASAAAANLHYICDGTPGISRERKGKGFIYLQGGKEVKDETTLARIKSLVIPPAWEHVWICKDVSGHLQATGTDVRGRKQYRYHPAWSALRSQTKFVHLHDFGKALPAIRGRVAKDLALAGMPQEKVLALVVSIMQETGIRIGNAAYEKIYGSFGLSTLRNKHVTIDGSEVRFAFKGKKGVEQDLKLKSRRLAKLLQQCREIPGKELFQFYDGKGGHHVIDSGMVNGYIAEVAGGHFTAKDFRTWAGTLRALLSLKDAPLPETEKDKKATVIAALDAVSEHLGNTRTVCKKYYVHPRVVTLFEDGKLGSFFEKEVTAAEGLEGDEGVLMEILAKA